MEATVNAATFPAVNLSNKQKWAGRILSGLPVAFLILDAGWKFVVTPQVVEASAKMGWPIAVNPYLGAVLLACVALYVFPRTAALGAVLLTGYLGGAVAVHVRVADPLFSHTLFPIYFGVMLWGGLFLRDARVRRLFAK
ncbi:MAG: DoxX family protein [Myxococcaceae bacterium]